MSKRNIKQNQRCRKQGTTLSASARRYRRSNAIRRIRFRNTLHQKRSSLQTAQIHRRFVLYPNLMSGNPSLGPWLNRLSWFASICLKIFTALSSVAGDLSATVTTIGSGTVMLLGAGDYAAFSPFAATVNSKTKTSSEIAALRAVPFERASLPFISIKIVPSADFGNRGGMYAAVLQPVDQEDCERIGITDYLKRFSPEYENLIKHPKAVLSPVNIPVRLTASSDVLPRDLRTVWTDEGGFYNLCPTYVLMVAFSDMATTKLKDVDDNYRVGKCLFEMHTVGHLRLYEPGELQTNYDVNENKNLYAATWSTGKVAFTDSQKLDSKKGVGLRIGHEVTDIRADQIVDGKVDLRCIPLNSARSALAMFDRDDLMLELEAHHLSLRK